MVENFIFSVNIVLPIFLVLFLGTCLRKINVMSEGFVSNGNALVFKIILPTSLFLSVFKSDVSSLMDVRFVSFCVGASLVSFFALWFICHLTIKDGPTIGAVVHGGIRGNFALLGFPLVTSIVGSENASTAALVVAFIIPTYAILATIVLTVYAGDGRKVNLGSLLISICKNPSIIGVVLGAACSLLRLRFPSTIMKTVEYVGSIATPLSLLCLGGSLDMTSRNPKIKYAFAAASYKAILQPVIFVPIALLMGFRSYELVTLLIMFGVPTAVASYAMTVQMKGDGYIASTSILLSTVMSVFSLTMFIYIFKTLGWL